MPFVATTIEEYFRHEGELKGERKGKLEGKLEGIREGERKGELQTMEQFHQQGIVSDNQYEIETKVLQEQLLALQNKDALMAASV